MIILRKPDDIYRAGGEIENGTFHGRWHFSFDTYSDPEYMSFGTLRVFNDDTLSPGAVWPLHPHSEIEVVTYCAAGEFRHADQNGKGGVLKKGWAQHTTVGRGMWHSEINNLPDAPMRFVQMWFFPDRPGLEPTVEQKAVERKQRTNRLLALVSSDTPDALPIHSDAVVFSSFLERSKSVERALDEGKGAYLYVVEGGPLEVSGVVVGALGAVKITDEPGIIVKASGDSELLLVEVGLI
jgi:quercetin 2,3-dioxygenase